jgi:hypothetical protein
VICPVTWHSSHLPHTQLGYKLWCEYVRYVQLHETENLTESKWRFSSVHVCTHTISKGRSQVSTCKWKFQEPAQVQYWITPGVQTIPQELFSASLSLTSSSLRSSSHGDKMATHSPRGQSRWAAVGLKTDSYLAWGIWLRCRSLKTGLMVKGDQLSKVTGNH